MLGCCNVAQPESEIDLCPLHQNFPLEKVCIQNCCLEPLCKVCETQHLEIHKLMNAQPKLMNIDIVKHYTLEECQREIRTLQQQQGIHETRSPKQQIMDMVDEFFHGTRHKRLGVLKQRQQILLNKPKIGSVINILLDEHRYMVPKNFESTLSLFLDKNLAFNNI